MQSFKAQLYGADLPLTGTGVEAYFTESRLCIPSTSMNPSTDDITMSVGGFEHNEFFLNWNNTAGIGYSLKLASKADIDCVIANAPPSLGRQFAKWHKRRMTIRIVWSSIATFSLVCVLSAILLWWRYDQAVAWLADHVSIKNEERLGQSVLAQIEGDGDIIKEGPAVKAIQDIGKRLTKNSRYRYQWLIKKDKTVNAFALPGGIVIVNSALIKKASNADELAAVLAHEVQHVENRHALQSMIHSLGWAAALMVVLGDVNAATAVIVHQLGNMYFSRDKENEADRMGVQTLIKARISPDGMVTFFTKLQKMHNTDAPVWLSSHPNIDERIISVRKMIKEQPCKPCKPLVYDWKKIQQDITQRKTG